MIKIPALMEIFELVVKPGCYELHRSGEREKLRFSTLLEAFTYAQLSMSGESAEMLVHGGDELSEHVPLYRMMA